MTADSLVSGLTAGERDVLELLATGATNPEIGTALSLAEGTVRKVVARITAKLGVDRTQAALLADRAGLGHYQDEDRIRG